MKKIFIIPIMIFLVSAGMSKAFADEPTAAVLGDWCKGALNAPASSASVENIENIAMCMGYFQGFASGYAYGQHASQHPEFRFCVPAGVSYEQISKSVVATIESDSKANILPAGPYLGGVLMGLFPCKP